jgi:hypothetical protein
MSTCQLTLLIDAADLPALRDLGLRIILARPVTETDVIWQTLDLAESTTIVWRDDQCGLYASKVAYENGEIISPIAEVPIPASAGAYYAFTSRMAFDGPHAGGTPGAYQIDNQSSSLLTFGVTQSAQVNNAPVPAAPISAESISPSQPLAMAPRPEICVWLQATVSSGEIVTFIDVNYVIVNYATGVNAVTLQYDATMGIFVLAGSSSDAERACVSVRKPSRG